MKAVIDEDSCRGHSACCAICPEVFDLSDDGYAVVLLPEIPAEYEAKVTEAVESCPERAISLR
jgi:ferredoxin